MSPNRPVRAICGSGRGVEGIPQMCVKGTRFRTPDQKPPSSDGKKTEWAGPKSRPILPQCSSRPQNSEKKRTWQFWTPGPHLHGIKKNTSSIFCPDLLLSRETRILGTTQHVGLHTLESSRSQHTPNHNAGHICHLYICTQVVALYVSVASVRCTTDNKKVCNRIGLTTNSSQ